MDVVRLAIVYETQQAASRLGMLNRQLGTAHTGTRRLSLAALSLAESMKTGEISSRGLERILHVLGGRMGWVGLAIGLTIATLLLLKRHTDKTSEAIHQFNTKLRDTRRAVDDLLRSDIRSPLQGEIEKITDAIGELDRTLAKERPNLWKRLTGDLSIRGLFGSAKRFVMGGADPEILRERAAQQAQLDRLKPQNLAGAMANRATADLERMSVFAGLTRGTLMDKEAEQVKRLEQELKNLLEILPADSEEVQGTARELLELSENLRKTERAAALLQSGLDQIAGAIEDFVVTATVSFSQLLDNIIRLFYRDLTGELIHGITRSVFSAGGGPSGGGGGGTAILGNPGGGTGITGSVQAGDVNFNISTMDSQGVSQWVQRNGAMIASEIGRQAARSAGLRRVFRR